MKRIVKWIQFRTLHSSGPSVWQYEEVVIDGDADLAKQLKGELDTLRDEHHTQTEHYRGVEGDFIASPPRKVLERRIARLKTDIGEAVEALSRAEKLLPAAPEQETDL